MSKAAHIAKSTEELVAENARLKAELAELKRLIFGRKSERFLPEQAPAEQLNLFIQHDHITTEGKTVKQTVDAHTRLTPRPRRIKLPDDLPVVELRIEPHPDAIKGWIKIGEDITEELDLDYVPAIMRINRYI